MIRTTFPRISQSITPSDVGRLLVVTRGMQGSPLAGWRGASGHSAAYCKGDFRLSVIGFAVIATVRPQATLEKRLHEVSELMENTVI